MFPLIPIAIKAAGMFLPSLIDKIAGDKVGKVAGKVLDTVASVTGQSIKSESDLATVQQIVVANPEVGAKLQESLINLQVATVQEQGDTLRTMLESDAKNAHTTRPKIAYQAFQIVGAVSMIIASLWAYAVAASDAEMVKSMMDGWPFIAALLGPFFYLLKAYFGILQTEQGNRLAAANGHPPATGLLSALFSRERAKQ